MQQSTMKAGCPRCGRESPLHFRVGDLNRRITDDIFDYYRCVSCGIIFLDPVPLNLGRYYPSDYYQVPTSLQKLALAAEPEQYKIDFVRRFTSGGSLLEIGPAYGSFCYLAKQAGFKVDAIEMDAGCCRFMNEVVGINAIHSIDTEAALRSAGPYDVIALWHVVEHLSNPWEAMKLFAQRLNPGGLLVMAAPNPDAFQFRVFGRFWTHLDAPRHLELIPSATLSEHARQLGLKPLLITTTDEGSLGWNAFGWEMSLHNLSGSRFVKRGLRLIGNIVSRIVAPIEHAERRGSAYTAVFRKDRQS